MRLRTKLFIAWGSLTLVLWMATLWPVQRIIASNFDRVADEGFAGTRRSLEAVQAERLKQMHQACWLVMNIPELRALIAEESSELSSINLKNLTERLDGLSELVGVDLVCVLDNRGTLIAQNHGSPWSTVDELSNFLTHSPAANALVHDVFAPTRENSQNVGSKRTQGLWADHRQLYQVVGVPLVFGSSGDSAPPESDGALIMASTITDALTTELGKGHNCQITFIADGSVVASTLGPPLRGELEAHYDPSDWKIGEAFETSLGGTAYRSWIEPLQDPSSRLTVGAMMVQISLAELQSTQSRISRMMFIILGSGLLAVALASYLLSGAVTRPVAELAEGVRKVAGGDLDLALSANQRDEIGELGGAFNDMVRQLRSRHELQRQVEESQAASRAKSQFLANMSHEIRTPLNGVVGLTQLLLTTPLDERQRRYADLVKSSADVLTTLINDVLDFSKIEAGQMELESIPFSPHAVVEEVVELLASKASRKGLEIACDVGAELPSAVRGDLNRTRQILINLVGNAVKFTETGAVVACARLESAADNQVVIRFWITDTGVGIPPDRRDRLFKSFSQIDTSTTRKHGGTGLGLAICKQLSELMGGSIGVESELGRGSTFWFTARFQQESDGAQVSETPRVQRPLRVIVVEPQSRTRDIIKRRLDECGVAVTTVADPAFFQTALREAASASAPFDVALIADHLPGCSGLQLGSTARSLPSLGKLRMILLVTSEHDLEPSTLPAAGFSGYLTKPVMRAKLKQAVLSDAESPARTSANAPSSAPPARSARILLAEDNEVNQLVVVDMLAAAGYRCDVVADGLSAVKAVEGPEHYDLILMDCQMPQMDGFEATRLIRQKQGDPASDGSRRRVPIIALTASAVQGDQQRCMEAGMDAYCTKPIDAPRLIEVIESHLEANARGARSNESKRADGAPQNDSAQPRDDTAPVNYATLLQRCGGKPDLAGRVLEALSAKISDAAQELQQCLQKHDAHELARLAHAIKGAAGMAAADDLQQAAARLEQLARAGTMDRLEQDMAALRRELQRCDQYIRSAVRGNVAHQDTPTDTRESIS